LYQIVTKRFIQRGILELWNMAKLYFFGQHAWEASKLNYIFVEKVTLFGGLAANYLLQFLKLLVGLRKLYIAKVA